MDDIDIEVSVRNYRCFSEAPVQFSLKNRIQSFVGVNNSGKSCLLKLFYEFRNIFSQLSNPNAITPLLNGQPCNFNLLPGTKDCNELLHDRNGDDLVIVLVAPIFERFTRNSVRSAKTCGWNSWHAPNCWSNSVHNSGVPAPTRSRDLATPT